MARGAGGAGGCMMRWHLSYRCDPKARPLADRHYNRQSIGADNFVPPGRCLVLTAKVPGSGEVGALWVTSWPLAEFTLHAWAGAWINSLFRNERPDLFLSSEMILEAVAATRAFFGDPPRARDGDVRRSNEDAREAVPQTAARRMLSQGRIQGRRGDEGQPSRRAATVARRDAARGVSARDAAVASGSNGCAGGK